MWFPEITRALQVHLPMLDYIFAWSLMYTPFLWVLGLNPWCFNHWIMVLMEIDLGYCGERWDDGKRSLLIHSQNVYAVMFGAPFWNAFSLTQAAALWLISLSCVCTESLLFASFRFLWLSFIGEELLAVLLYNAFIVASDQRGLTSSIHDLHLLLLL